MKSVGRYFSMAAMAAVGLAACPASARPVPACSAPAPALGPEFAPVSPRALTYPTFCSIPPTPTDLRGATIIKGEVVRTRLAGAWLVSQTAPETFSLAGTQTFDEGAKREATPPPPMTPPGAADTATFVAQSKAKARPPRRPR